jgi:hypothetical protein
VFRVAKAGRKGGQGVTQFGRALAELGIEILCANSSQAKGRVERVNRTLQDRLAKELRLAGISDSRGRQRVPAGFMARFNARFAVAPARPGNRHRPLTVAPDRLRQILMPGGAAPRRPGADALLRPAADHARAERRDGGARGEVRRHLRLRRRPAGGALAGLPLPYKAFDKDQRVSHAAIVENKRLGEVLAFIKSQQDRQRPPPRVLSSRRPATAGPGETRGPDAAGRCVGGAAAG